MVTLNPAACYRLAYTVNQPGLPRFRGAFVLCAKSRLEAYVKGLALAQQLYGENAEPDEIDSLALLHSDVHKDIPR